MGIVKILSTGTNYSTFVTGSIAVQNNGTSVSSSITNLNFVNYTNLTTSGTTLNIYNSGPYDVGIYTSNVLSVSQQIARIEIPRTVTFISNFSPSLASSGVSATAQSKLTIAQNGTAVGTITFGAGSSTGTISATATVFNSGDILTITGPASPDSTLSQISITLSGTR
jgi:hypothetical protein